MIGDAMGERDEHDPAEASTTPPTTATAVHFERIGMAWPEAAASGAADGWRPEDWWAPPSLLEAAIEPPLTADGTDAAAPAVSPARRLRPAQLVREVVETLVMAGVMLVVLTALVRNYQIDGTSMAPTLAPAEYILVNKVVYATLGEPTRGDVIVFRDWNDNEDYIKRVVGLPGETVEIRDGQVVVDGAPLAEPYLDGVTTGGGSGAVRLGPDEYFVLGDNRGNSSDSRVHGPLPRDHIVGRAWLTYWPLSHFRRLANGAEAFDGPDA